MARRVSTREGRRLARHCSRASSNINLSALHIVLRTALTVSRVKGDKLDTHEVVAWGNAARHVEI